MFIGFQIDPQRALAVVLGADGLPVKDDLDQLELPKGVDLAQGLRLLVQQAAQHFKRIKPTTIALLDTTKSSQWQLSHLRPRVQLETAILIAAATVEIQADRVSPHDACKPLKVAHNKLAEGARARTAFSSKERAEAAAVAWYAAGIWPSTDP